MNIISLDKTKLVFVPQSLEDLWIIKTITDKNDTLSGTSYRRTRGNENDDSSERKPVFVALTVEKFDFSSELNSLRFTGKVCFSKPEELIPLGEYHTLEINLNKTYTLSKNYFYRHQLDLLNSSSFLEHSIILVSVDDEKANLYKLTNTGVSEITEIYSGKHGKRYFSEFDYSNYFNQIHSILINYDSQLIIAGAGNTKSKLSSFIKAKNKSTKILEVNLSNRDRSSVTELFKKPEISRFFTNSIVYKEQKIFDKFLENLGKDNRKAIYGLKEIEEAINFGAVDTILISENLWKEDIDNISEVIKKAESLKIKIHIVDSTHDIHNSLKTFGGIIAILRFAYS